MYMHLRAAFFPEFINAREFSRIEFMRNDKGAIWQMLVFSRGDIMGVVKIQ